MASYLDQPVTPTLHPRELHARKPLVLLVPGLSDSGPDHWQSHWEREAALKGGADIQRVQLGLWDEPHRNTWVNKLNLAIQRANRPVVLVAHSLGCMAVAWWAEYEQPERGLPVVAALLVAPPDVDRPGADPRIARFTPAPRRELPFAGFLVASRNDPWCSRRAATELARDWGLRFADAGPIGHINAESGIGDWSFGKLLLNQLLREQAQASHGLGGDGTPPQSAISLPEAPIIHSRMR